MHESLGFYIGGYFIAYYGLFILIGISLAMVLAYIQIKKNQLRFNDYIIIVAVSALFAIIVSKILYLIVEYKNINYKLLITDARYLSSIMSSGFVFYGALIGGLFGIYLVKRIFKIEFKPYLRVTTFVFPLVHAFGRIGCHTVGCCHGIEYKSPISIMYKNSIIAPNNVWLFPVQLSESIANFIIAGIILYFSKKIKDYEALYLYIILYALVRFTMEFLRGDIRRGLFMSISTSQYISIGLFIIFMILFIKSKKKGALDVINR